MAFLLQTGSGPMPQIGLHNRWILDQFARRAVSNHLSLVEDVSSFRKAHHRLHDVLDHQKSMSFVPMLTDDGDDFVDLRWDEACHDLIEQQQFGAGGKSAGELQPLRPAMVSDDAGLSSMVPMPRRLPTSRRN